MIAPLESLTQTNALYLLTDSRQLTLPSQTLFFAINGERHDGHRFVESLYQKGVRQFVVERAVFDLNLDQKMPNATIWVVENSILALQELAKHRRKQFQIPVVGITGSNGKTIVKEWLSQLLSPDFWIVKSPKSYNSQIGVPLSVWQLNERHTLGVFEAGISHPHEMQALQQIIRPTMGIFTNIGSAHDEGFRSRKQKITEKLRLFTTCQVLVYCADYQDIDEEIKIILQPVNPSCELVGWGSAAHCAVQTHIDKQIDSTNITLTFKAEASVVNFAVPFTDDASVENAIHCAVLMRKLGISARELSPRLGRLRPVSMRLELKEGINGCQIIDDSYNNDLVGLNMALNFLNQQEQRSEKVVVLSEVLQTGQPEDELYAQIAALLSDKKVNQLIAIGAAFVRNQALFPENTRCYDSTETFLNNFDVATLRNALVLVKGARPFQFERIVNRLQQRVHGTVLEINLDAITHNLNYYRQRMGSQTKIMVMVKAFAYGSGSAEVAQLLQFHRVDYLAVAYADEGVQLRQNGIELPIMVMNPARETFDKLREYRLEPEIYSQKIFDEWLVFSEQYAEMSPIHLKLDTGMHRLGFVAADLPQLLDQLKTHPTLRVATIFSHLVGADEATHNGFSALQYERFMAWTAQIEAVLGYCPTRHILNSAGIVRFPDYKLDMVRLGIGLYGVEVNQQEQHALQPVGTLKTVVSQVKHLPAGETVGYSRRGVLEREATIATIAIGYADGYDRRFSNGVGKVLINRQLCSVVGNVCMDMTMVDATNAAVQAGDEVVIFDQHLPITDLARQIGTIPYEILTGVSERVKRVFFKESN
ncbi:MAG: bifunctional UDP-N-acetylmuramoyl-tripeptide:D-alanyl-D-alanine ligase/alanine racemase [Cytophagia bacterium]|nr:MAG: bifunctional UDP-N-acetylmuramoyl-tripeptide:D-alanyl-D-alanine ligase/alanine racemase [Runella sp.]TAG20576.1 MAG: bifunctional UDP-N-acetylmuramoyl-tripeptide:D-alanyl-D-alanine ligase/alanine racemase [Cytophagales bacterium]TAG39748.1 MAG: bifunctional UDP-N-acetylmuramoyl-tripeptide:D-alanyl-D-alanine ligase/alanine racemase [Cytophagia bacterium]TAG81376.1 MAG: bifunctional UDP-N-acetylmuramoyl-tripeptide:D-alanyl-D-alanine ligase/alanine racemase [Cytophagales bacterium]